MMVPHLSRTWLPALGLQRSKHALNNKNSMHEFYYITYTLSNLIVLVKEGATPTGKELKKVYILHLKVTTQSYCPLLKIDVYISQ